MLSPPPAILYSLSSPVIDQSLCCIVMHCCCYSAGVYWFCLKQKQLGIIIIIDRPIEIEYYVCVLICYWIAKCDWYKQNRVRKQKLEITGSNATVMHICIGWGRQEKEIEKHERAWFKSDHLHTHKRTHARARLYILNSAWIGPRWFCCKNRWPWIKFYAFLTRHRKQNGIFILD